MNNAGLVAKPAFLHPTPTNGVLDSDEKLFLSLIGSGLHSLMDALAVAVHGDDHREILRSAGNCGRPWVYLDVFVSR